MFYDNDHYNLRQEEVAGLMHYYIAHTDVQDVSHETEVTKAIYDEFLQLGKSERNLRRWDERHKERLDLTEAEIYDRALRLPQSVEEQLLEAEQNELLRQAITELPEVQRRRLLMYYKDGMTFEEIAEQEKRHWTSIAESVRAAEEKSAEK